MMWGYGFGWGWLMMAFGTVLWIALLAVLVWAIIRWVDRKTVRPGPPATGTPAASPSALEILQQRYARGEIDTATFEQMRERLQASNPQASEMRAYQPSSDIR
ncbi:MAG: SHOCT domain-containing protein [Ktedonobacteraceae bacterium]|nr:SHOCT domain-containing protein [Ktedonobacteraceae bacterium]